VNLAPPERLLQQLVHHRMGAMTQTLGEDCIAARHELARRGHVISAVPAAEASSRADLSGREAWRLQCAAEHFSPQRFVDANTSELGQFLHVWEACDSTNGLAREAAHAGDVPHGSLWLAETQHHGRGRQGRRWSCPPHRGLLFSVLLRPPTHIHAPQLLPLAIALGVCEGLRRATHCNIHIKWPNDLYLHGEKLGGILVETRFAEPGRIVVGCGVNVSVEPDSLKRDGVPHAASLHLHAATLPEREVILAHILAAVQTRYEEWCMSACQAILAEWPRYDLLRNKSVRLQSAERFYEGVARGLAPDGSLVIGMHDGTKRHFTAAEVHLT